MTSHPQPPSSNDTQNEAEYRKELEAVERRMNYTEGFHVNSTYTTLAHLWLIKQLIGAKEIKMSDAMPIISYVKRIKPKQESKPVKNLLRQFCTDRPIYNLIAFRHFYGKEFLLSTRQLRPAPTPSKKIP